MATQDINLQLLGLFLPEGILDHFDITDFQQESSGQVSIWKKRRKYLKNLLTMNKSECFYVIQAC
jgi:hypothetical protein